MFFCKFRKEIFSSNVSAFFPATHWYMTDKALETPIDSNLYGSCAKYPKLCYSGNILADVSVNFYYTYFQRYAVTHSPSFCRALLDEANGEEEMACAVGGCIHQPQDIHSHTVMMPYSIEHTFIPNVVIHPFAEQGLENELLKIRPDAKIRSEGDLNDFNKCSGLFKRVLSGEEDYMGVDLDELFRTFITEIQGSKTGYDIQFNRIQVIPPMVLIVYIAFTIFLFLIWMLLIVRRLRFKERRTLFTWISFALISFFLFLAVGLFLAFLGGSGFRFFQAIIKPISNFVPLGDTSDDLINTGIQNSKNFLTQGEIWLQNTDSSGQLKLEQANRAITIPQYIILFILTSLIALFVWLNFRGTSKPKYVSYSSTTNI